MRTGLGKRAAATLTVLAALAATLLAAQAASAASGCGTRGVYTASGDTATCTYGYTGSEDTFIVPSFVSSLSVTAVGASGGGGPYSGGGRGAVVTNTALAVVPSAELWVDVGGGQFPDGGPVDDSGDGGGGGGGGSSVVLTSPLALASLTGDPATDSRLLVAGGGGGGAGYGGAGRNGGNAGVDTNTGAGNGCGGAGGVGPTDGSDGGGLGCNGGGDGTAAGGGSGNCTGASGGGGWFGGGGAGCYSAGGGGSSYGGAAPSPSDISISTASSQTPEVAISWALKSTSLTAAPQLVLFEPFVGVGNQVVQATLTASGSPLAGQTISFTDGSTALCSAPTNSKGIARCTISPQDQRLLSRNNEYTATYAGTTVYAAASSTVPAIAFF